jgi:hypothetical protein
MCVYVHTHTQVHAHTPTPTDTICVCMYIQCVCIYTNTRTQTHTHTHTHTHTRTHKHPPTHIQTVLLYLLVSLITITQLHTSRMRRRLHPTLLNRRHRFPGLIEVSRAIHEGSCTKYCRNSEKKRDDTDSQGQWSLQTCVRLVGVSID